MLFIRLSSNSLIIKIFQFIVDPGLLSFKLKVAHKILIGNVPLRSSFANFQHGQPGQQVIRGEDGAMLGVGNPFLSNPQNAFPISSSYPDLRKYYLYYFLTRQEFNFDEIGYFLFNLAPPTYEECMFGGEIRDAEDSEHVDYGAGVSYNPRYVTYR